MSGIEICCYNGNQKEWNDFVENHPEGRFFQLIGYKQAIEQTYGYEGLYYIFKRNSEIIALLPSFKLNSVISGKRLLSLPFAEYGGLLGNNLSLEELYQISELLQQVLLDNKFPFLEIHGGLGINPELMSKIFYTVPMYQYAILPLGNAKDIWDHSVDYQVRKAVRKAQKANLVAYEQTTEESIIKKFYPLYLLSMKRLGTPPHPSRLFLNYLNFLSDNMKLFLVDDKDATIAALLGFVLGKRVHIIHIASDPKHWDKRPNDLVHWTFIEWACENSYEIFDFAIIRYDGQQRYKDKWGVQKFNYSYYYLLSKEKNKKYITPVDPSVRQSIRLFSWFWKSCVPICLSETLGFPIRKQLGR
ncbi:TPA: GNAT family N-acetyltransferase [Candidatus Poribacteria bacterium]|nr:GNAT family N-acetyltransferase [Candidatus Poribacteria bacterium]